MTQGKTRSIQPNRTPATTATGRWLDHWVAETSHTLHVLGRMGRRS